MKKKIYVVSTAHVINEEVPTCRVIGVFETKNKARECFNQAKAMRKNFANKGKWIIETDTNNYFETYREGWFNCYFAVVSLDKFELEVSKDSSVDFVYIISDFYCPDCESTSYKIPGVFIDGKVAKTIFKELKQQNIELADGWGWVIHDDDDWSHNAGENYPYYNNFSHITLTIHELER